MLVAGVPLWLAGCSSPPAAGTTNAAPAALGLACGADGDCGSGLCIEEERANGGVSWTAGSCSQSCSDSAPCPATSACVAFEDASSWCLTRCSAAADCRAGYVCSTGAGACLPDCRLGFSCGTSLSCDAASGSCVRPPGMRAIGASCQFNSDCASALCTVEQSSSSGKIWAEGYCTAACTAAAPCANSATCITYADGSSFCAATCAADTDCRGGYVCSRTAKSCLPDCRQGFNCGTSLVCDASSGNCVGSMLPIGAGCSLNIDCASGLCTPAASTSGGVVWNGGYCTQACGAATACPAAATCITYADGTSYCAAACTSSSECRTGYICSPGVAACLPDCRQGFSCGTALSCDASSGACG